MNRNEIPYQIGILVPDTDILSEHLKSTKNNKRTDRKYPAIVMLLMMFRSANREVMKLQTKTLTKGKLE